MIAVECLKLQFFNHVKNILNHNDDFNVVTFLLVRSGS